MATKNNPGAFDCYEKAEPDEPMFVLLGRDKHAPTLVWLWCVLRELDGEKPEIVAEAQHVVVEMLQWMKAHDRPAVGLGQAALAAVLELMRAANHAAKDADNAPTTIDFMRLLMAETTFESATDAAKQNLPPTGGGEETSAAGGN